MPNHCHNRLWLRGNPDEVQTFIKTVEENKSEKGALQICETFFPCPEELRFVPATFGSAKDEDHARLMEEMTQKYGSKDWYDWCINNWGTKWGDYDTYLTNAEDDTPMYVFDSAWSPPHEALLEISKKFPEMEFVHFYREEGMGFFGISIYRDGDSMDDCRNFEDLPEYQDAENAEDDEDRWEKVWQAIGTASRDLLIEYGFSSLISEEELAESEGF